LRLEVTCPDSGLTRDPHEIPGQAGDSGQALREARVVCENGLDMEAFLDRLCESVSNSPVVVIDQPAGAQLIRAEQGQAQENDQDHGHATAGEPHILA